MAWHSLQHLPLTLAQDAAPDPAPDIAPADTTVIEKPLGPSSEGDVPPPAGPFGGQMWLIFLLVLVVMWIFLIGGQRKEKKKRAELLAALKKGDKVQTLGGILGTVVEVRDAEVVVKVDENANTRLRFARSAIASVIAGEAAKDPKA